MTPDAGRRPYIAGNWKMFKTSAEARSYVQELRKLLPGDPAADVGICVPFTALAATMEAAEGSDIRVCAQNMHQEAEGAYTGEVSPPLLQELGVRGAIVGHSERRQYFGESDTAVARRARAALAAGLQVIACVGETQEERDSGDTQTVLRIQVEAIADACGSHDRLVVAYEPVWAIGTGLTATPELAQEAHAFIKRLLDRPVLYGGSVKPDNAAELMAQPDIDGALVGGASLEIDSFAAICEAAAASRS
jgi:triosephosphate isomerase (TIM)